MEKKTLIFVTISFLINFSFFAETIGNNDDEIKKMAEPILKNIFEGIEKKDYQIYSKDFDNKMKEALPESKFLPTLDTIITQFGEIKERHYLGYLNIKDYTLILWKGKFSNTSDDVLIQLVCSRKNNKIYIIGLWFK